MIVFSMYWDAVDSWRQAFKMMGPWYEFLARTFEYLNTSTNLVNPQSFTKCRDKLRNLLSGYDVDTFPPPGNRHTSIKQVFDAFMKNSSYSVTLSQRFTCSAGCPVVCNVLYLPNACSSGNWENAARRTDFLYTQDEASIQLFIDLQISAKIVSGIRLQWNQCGGPHMPSVFLPRPSPWLFFCFPQCMSPPTGLSNTQNQRRVLSHDIPFICSCVL